MKRILVSFSGLVLAGAVVVVAPPAVAAQCEWQWGTYTALMEEAIANDDADLLYRAQGWYRDWEACMAREAANPTPTRPTTPPTGSGSSSGSPTRPNTTVPRPQASQVPSCSQVQQPTPRGRQINDTTAVFEWDAHSLATDYRVNTNRTTNYAWEGWTGYRSLGTATSLTVPIESGGRAAINVVIKCSGTADGKIYPTGTAYVQYTTRTYSLPAAPADWKCSSGSQSEMSCSQSWTYSKNKSRNAKRSIDKVLSAANLEWTTVGVTPATVSVDAQRGKKRALVVTVTARIVGTPNPYPSGTFSTT